MPDLRLLETLLQQSPYYLLELVSKYDNLPTKIADLIKISDNILSFNNIPPKLGDPIKNQAKKLLSLYPNTYSFLCAHNQAEKADEVLKEIKAQQQSIAKHTNVPEYNNKPLKEAFWEEYQAYLHAYWLARAHTHTELERMITKHWLLLKNKPEFSIEERDITNSRHIKAVLFNTIYAGDIKNLIPLWKLAKANFPLADDQVSLLYSGVANAINRGEINVIQQCLISSAEDKKALSQYLEQNPENYLDLIRHACKSGHIDSIYWVIALAKNSTKAPNLFAITSDHYPLVEACSSGNLDTVKLVLKQLPAEKNLKSIRNILKDFTRNAMLQNCFAGNTKVLTKLTQYLTTKQEFTEVFPLHNPQEFCLYEFNVSTFDFLFDLLQKKYSIEEIVTSKVYIGCIVEAIKNARFSPNKQHVAHLLGKVPEEYLQQVKKLADEELKQKSLRSFLFYQLSNCTISEDSKQNKLSFNP
ncbi:hypothetical protein [Rickettsiella endosymbiont of Aleochara curtula]|uniref:hypothetical protein n=1 Tax=Rickettsiella endosymbiont of Aleochara curtula TaxID=3077936 RepID=UPI00313AB1BA